MIKGNSKNSSSERELSAQEEVGIRRDVKAVNTTVMLLSQKMGYIVRNEKVLSKNILLLNEKLKTIDERVSKVSTDAISGGVSTDELDPIKAQITELYNKVKGVKSDIDSLRSEIESLNNSYATKSEIKELKYLIDAINPLEFVTYKQLKDEIKELKK